MVMSDPSRVVVSGPLSAFAPGFLDELLGQGYRPGTASKQLQLLAHLSRWMAERDLEPGALHRVELERFVKDRRASGRVQLASVRALGPLLRYLSDLAGAPALASREGPTPAGALVERYADHLLVRRGLAAETVRGYCNTARAFLADRERIAGDLALGALDVAAVNDYLLRLFPTSRGRALSRDAVALLVNRHVATASGSCPTLATKTVTPHVLRHTAAMNLLHAGVDTSVIALWLGHESTEATQIYLHADMAIKERALARTTPAGVKPGRYRPADALLAFLERL
jgi:hypothetical protein